MRFQAAKVAPQDRDVRKKLADCEREVKRLRFEEALAVPVGVWCLQHLCLRSCVHLYVCLCLLLRLCLRSCVRLCLLLHLFLHLCLCSCLHLCLRLCPRLCLRLSCPCARAFCAFC